MLYDKKWDKPDLTKPSLEGLSYLLRNEGLWPKGFKWNYSFRCSCAIGLSSMTWGLGVLFTLIPSDKYTDIFEAKGDWIPRSSEGYINPGAVSPDMVADKIDQYLAGK